MWRKLRRYGERKSIVGGYKRLPSRGVTVDGLLQYDIQWRARVVDEVAQRGRARRKRENTVCDLHFGGVGCKDDARCRSRSFPRQIFAERPGQTGPNPLGQPEGQRGEIGRGWFRCPPYLDPVTEPGDGIS